MWQERAEERSRQLVDARGDAAAEGKGGVEVSGVRSEWDKVCGGVGGHGLCGRRGRCAVAWGGGPSPVMHLCWACPSLFWPCVIMWIKKLYIPHKINKSV